MSKTMTKYKHCRVQFPKISNVWDFVEIINRYKLHGVFICEDRHICANSLMGILSLNLSRPLILEIDRPDSEDFADFLIVCNSFDLKIQEV